MFLEFFKIVGTQYIVIGNTVLDATTNCTPNPSQLSI